MITLFLEIAIVLLVTVYIFRPQEVKHDFSCLKFSDFWNWNGQIERSPYLVAGLILFFINIVWIAIFIITFIVGASGNSSITFIHLAILDTES